MTNHTHTKPSRSFVLSALQGDKGGQMTILAILAAVILIPAANMMLPASHPLHVETFTISLLGKYLSYAMLALAVDLVWGYLGILSLGHGAFFALGGYAMGMYLMRQIGDRGVYGHPILSDFMVFLNWQELPWFWHGFDQFWFAALMVVLVPGAMAYVFGYLAFRSRVSGVYLSIITQALTYALMLAFFRNEMGFGGNNGLTDFKDILGFSLQQDRTRIALFIATGIALIVSYLVCRSVVASRLGRVSVAIRDSESRTRFMGYDVDGIKLWVFVLSAVIAGIAGALYVPQVGIINPGEFAPLNSIEVVVWVALGGRATLFGAIVGALVINYAKSWFTVEFPEVWLFALGGLFVLSTLYFPKGLIGFVSDKWHLVVNRNRGHNATESNIDEEKSNEVLV
ncbi:urea ABC transporter permease subunit UrtC [Vibrio europaeus]|uniref:Urea ABC transporter permease subunit UrtC n=1 Tax=Vibrio europaeus TaxID=300876 RepID=A0A178J7Y9_9VIBR|nr:urea ABC transporter permease subunit UrtC [Vibrio europaeus]MDC5705496.1 urea ABC transporter permease subunit UrtC [Vibrio europaeus]MDC5710775.1 urea ABC transporter permease subunit UrtC [Vibrio europaeus]MDC5715865.1 urea ABC transporter permease subunit UrtC [Vibrio europaeus]MDC5720026.1 urea ABC transporter permease subunit UrtC [Vibrio europaeus]MDC5724087.1 urea ABC transporter permease subunit UrtC [Vibrio europaeus]